MSPKDSSALTKDFALHDSTTRQALLDQSDQIVLRLVLVLLSTMLLTLVALLVMRLLLVLLPSRITLLPAMLLPSGRLPVPLARLGRVIRHVLISGQIDVHPTGVGLGLEG